MVKQQPARNLLPEMIGKSGQQVLYGEGIPAEHKKSSSALISWRSASDIRLRTVSVRMSNDVKALVQKGFAQKRQVNLARRSQGKS